MSLFETQVAAGVVLFVGALLSGCLPFLFRFNWQCCSFRYANASGPRHRAISFLLCFAGGVLFSAALLQLLPGSQRRQWTIIKGSSNINTKATGEGQSRIGNESSHHHYYHHDHHHSFPLMEFVALCSFFVIYFIEVLLFFVLERKSLGPNADRGSRTKFCSCSQRNIECSRMYKPAVEPIRADKRKRSATWSGRIPEPPGQKEKSDHHGCQPDLLRSSIGPHPFPNYGAVTPAAFEPVSLPIRVDGITLINRPVSSPSQLPGIPEIPSNTEELHTSVSLTTIVSVAALSFQAVFEGFVIGAQKTEASTWNLLLAVAIRKYVIIFVVGTQAVLEGCQLALLFAGVFVFALISPASLAVIMSFSNDGQDAPFSLSEIINSIAAGTFLYVTFFEVFPLNSKNSSYCHLKFVGKTMGAAAMAILLYATT